MTRTKNIPIEKIEVNPYQPRKTFNEDKLFELAQSIRENGLIQPIVVRKLSEDSYEIIAGERRYRALQLIGRTEAPAIVSEADDELSASLALVENIQREDLNPVEEAYAYKTIIQTEKITQSALAKRLGKSQSAIANKIRLLDLSDSILSSLAKQEISERHARALIGVETEKAEAILDKVLNEKLNVKETESLINKPKRKKKPVIRGYSNNIRIGINTVKEALSLVGKTGITVKEEIVETEDEVVMTIRFPK